MRPRPALFAAALLVPALLGVQCEDSAARLRADNRAALERAATDLQRIVALPAQSGSEGSEARRSELQRLLQTVQGIRGASELDSSTALLSGVIQREVALTSLDEAADIEIDLSRQRHVMRVMLGQAQRLQALAEGRSGANVRSAQQDVAASRAEAARNMVAYRQDADDLQSPIAELRQANTADQAEIDRLLAQAAALRREAAAMSPATGFARFQDAVAMEREADQYAGRLSHREIDLEIELMPELRVAEARTTGAAGLVQTAEATAAALHEFERQLSDDATATLDAARVLGSEVIERLEAVNAQLDLLRETYDEADAALETGLSQAQKGTTGARGAEADSARVTAARLALAMGQAAMSRARGLADHAGLLERLLATNNLLPDAGDLKTLLASSRAAMSQAAQRASESVKRANELIGQVSDPSVRKGLINSPAALQALQGAGSGGAVNLAIPMPGAAEPSESPANTSARGGAGSTHQALLEQWFRTAAEPAAADLMHSSTPNGRMLIQSVKRLNRAAAGFNKAVEEKFGSQQAQAAALFGAGFDPGAGNATIASESANRVVYEFPPLAGTTQRLPMILVGDSWFVDADGLAQDMGPALALLRATAEVLERDGAELADRIRKGEFPSAQALGLEVGVRVANLLKPPTSPP